MIEKVKITSVKPNKNNPRTIKDVKFRKLIESIKQFPEMLKLRPIIVNKEDVILGGNMRYKASVAAGLKEIWVLKTDELTPEQEKEFVIKDNSSFGEWDWDVLANEYTIEDLGEWGLELPNGLQTPEEEEEELLDEDNFDETAEEVNSKIKLGDLITFSKDGEVLHKLYCGDSTLQTSWNTLMGEEKGELIYTDPPYGISYTGANTPTAKVWDMIENDELRGDSLSQFLTEAFNLAYEYSKKDTAAYCWYSSSNHTQFRNGLNAANWEIKQDLIWNKGMTLGRADYHWAHEPCLYLKKNGQRTHWYGNRKHKTILNSTQQDLSKLSKQDLLDIFERIQQDSSVWEIKRDARLFYIHPNQKPIELAGRAISNSSQNGDIIIDMFSGSGSTLVAAHKLNRKFRGMEMDTKYAQLIINRLERTDPDLEIKIQHTI